MAPVIPPPCSHGLRPGTTVCLHCRQEARLAARHHRIRTGTRIGLLTLGCAVLVTLVVGGLTAVAPDARSFGRAASDEPHAGKPPAAAVPTAPARVRPIIAEGRKELGDSVFAIRSGDQVTVSFDTEALRTRFDWKFEGIVRATLPILFGPDISRALDSIPSGRFVRDGRLLVDLPQRGVPLMLVDGRMLRVWPITRAGRDGPLVVGYRASDGR